VTVFARAGNPAERISRLLLGTRVGLRERLAFML
jgi:hypothetical protein